MVVSSGLVLRERKFTQGVNNKGRIAYIYGIHTNAVEGRREGVGGDPM